MILQRIAKGIKEQDWFVVTIEIMIVVIGIFIGLQVDDWNQNRKENISAHIVLDRLEQDFTSIAENAERIRDGYIIIYQATERIMNCIEAEQCFTEDYSEALFRRDLDRIIQGNAPLKRSSTYIELLSSGQTHLIRDGELRTALADFDSLVLQTNSVYAIFHDMQMRYAEALLPAVVFDDELPDKIGSNGMPTSIRSYDMEMLRSDPAILGAISMIKRSHIYNVFWQNSLYESATDVSALIAAQGME